MPVRPSMPVLTFHSPRLLLLRDRLEAVFRVFFQQIENEFNPFKHDVTSFREKVTYKP